jgi:DNA-binding HxlR family transcriptional regulator
MAEDGNAGTGTHGCPLDPVLGLLAHKWLVHIVWLLGRGESLRFAELQRQLPGDVSAKVLSARLKELERLDMVARDDKGTSPPHVEYRLTANGRSIDGLLENLELKARGLPLSVMSQDPRPEKER